ncbi:MAG: flagellar hook-length control protein FliK [Pseudobdellovibrio sp.]
MLDKFLAVSPPQKGLAQDSKSVDNKNLHADLKKEFDQKLKEKMQDKSSSSKDSPKDQKLKEVKDTKDELRAEVKAKKPSGGIKKKMVDESVDTTISNIMASTESEIEIPDQKKDLALVETNDSAVEKKEALVGFDSSKVFGKDVGAKANTLSKNLVDSKIGQAMPASPKNEAIQATDVVAESSDELPQEFVAPQLEIKGVESKFKSVDSKLDSKDVSKINEAAIGLPLQGLSTKAIPANVAAEMAQVAQQSKQADASVTVPASAMKLQAATVGVDPMVAMKLQAAMPNSDEVKTDPSDDESAEVLKDFSIPSSSTSMNPFLQMTQALPTNAVGFSMSQGLQSSSAASEVVGTENLNQAQALQTFEDTQNSNAIQPAVFIQTEQTKPSKAEEMSFDQQLEAEVGFKPDDASKKEMSKADLVKALKNFESEKGMSSEKASAFELKVLAQLRQENSFSQHQGKNSEVKASEFANKDNPDSSGDTMKELKADVLKPDALMHAGQSQHDFRTHMNSPTERVEGQTTLAQLQERREENIHEVMKQTQFLAAKGGGEMTVKMSPDGMGPIQLKVLMQDGKVSIEMQTQDKSVKKLIEDSLTELKSGLAAQRIHVDHVRIDTVNATNTENSTQAQSGQSQADAQGRQQEFWKQFRENSGNQARKNSYNEVQSVGSRPTNDPKALKPISTSAARSGGRTGSTINRVA